ncbi:hypothetical protein [Nocardia sp. NPDC059239]|uniref:hypothetical protein n=1 Tax=unclassified Nocardia TaxID=2637762 RepID=UPI00369B7A9C
MSRAVSDPTLLPTRILPPAFGVAESGGGFHNIRGRAEMGKEARNMINAASPGLLPRLPETSAHG